MGQLRANDQKAFQTSEKETMVAIASLRTAIGVLKAKYDEFEKEDKRDYKAEQEQLAKDKEAGKAASLTHIADSVAKAMKLLPVNQFNLVLNGETGAILQGFLARPDEFVPHKKAGLTQMGSKMGADGHAILGILEQLMETFTADLAAMQDKEKLGISTHESTKSAKETQISAMEASISTKEGQLAHYTTMNAQAKEDLAYLRETNKYDIQYLAQVRDQCSSSENEYAVRKQTREDEIAALAEGISILTAGAGVQNAAGAQAVQGAAAAAAMVAHGRRVKRVFNHPHGRVAKRAVLKVPALKANATGKGKLAAQKPMPKAVPSFLQVKRDSGARPMDSTLHRSIAALESQVRLAHRQLSMGPLTNSAIQSVVTQIDVVVVQLQTQKKLEIAKKEKCVSEQNQATEQRQRRITDKARLDNEIVTLKGNIKSATEKIGSKLRRTLFKNSID